MDLALSIDQDRNISEIFEREGGRLRNFIRRRVADAEDAEDVLQEVFYALVQATPVLQPVEHVTAWLFHVASNRIIDLFRKKRDVALTAEQWNRLQDFLPSLEAGPEALYARGVLLDELDAALDELPEEQRRVFVAHELEGRNFKELAEESGVSVNTLVSRKHYAVLHLRRRLQDIYKEFV